MSIINFIRTLPATSAVSTDSLPVGNTGLLPPKTPPSTQNAEITSSISVFFIRRGCCSLSEKEDNQFGSLNELQSTAHTPKILKKTKPLILATIVDPHFSLSFLQCMYTWNQNFSDVQMKEN